MPVLYKVHAHSKQNSRLDAFLLRGNMTSLSGLEFCRDETELISIWNGRRRHMSSFHLLLKPLLTYSYLLSTPTYFLFQIKFVKLFFQGFQ